MAIGTIHGISNGYYQIPVSPIKRVELETVKEKEQAEQINSQTGYVQSLDEQETSRTQSNLPKNITDLENISLNFNSGETYEYIGKDKPIENLDVKQALSEMQKDQLLEDYQYFVGNNSISDEIFKSTDGIVVMK